VLKKNSAPAQALSAALSTAFSLSLLISPVQAANAPANIGGLLAEDYAFVDDNKDGIISLDEFRSTSNSVAEEQAFTAPNDEVLRFSMKLFDMNQDGKLTPHELMTGFALDSVVSEDEIDAGAVRVFDKDQNGTVSLQEFKSGLGVDLGPNGEQLQEWVFRRVDSLQDGNQQLDLKTELGDAITLMRANILGY